jgi:peroxiredoxin
MVKSNSKSTSNYKKLFLFVFIICPLVSLGQENNFVLKVHFNEPHVKILFITEAYFFKPFNAATFKIDSSNAQEANFIFEGKVSYPTAVRLMSYNDSIRFKQLIFIDSGYQEINIIRGSNGYIVESGSAVEKEHKIFLEQMKTKDMDEKIPGEKMLTYIKSNPDSYVGLFALINQTFNYYYLSDFQKILDVFGDEIKHSKGFQYYKSLYAPGKKLADYSVYTKNKKLVKLNFTNDENKYTFLEFWFKGCVGCQEELDKIKGTYSESLRKKLNIISISTDSGKYFEPSRKYIQKQKVLWKNYWDWEAESIKRFTFIYAYPSNLLINSSGNIIAKNVDFSEIDEFLN